MDHTSSTHRKSLTPGGRERDGSQARGPEQSSQEVRSVPVYLLPFLDLPRRISGEVLRPIVPQGGLRDRLRLELKAAPTAAAIWSLCAVAAVLGARASRVGVPLPALAAVLLLAAVAVQTAVRTRLEEGLRRDPTRALDLDLVSPDHLLPMPDPEVREWVESAIDASGLPITLDGNVWRPEPAALSRMLRDRLRTTGEGTSLELGLRTAAAEAADDLDRRGYAADLWSVFTALCVLSPIRFGVALAAAVAHAPDAELRKDLRALWTGLDGPDRYTAGFLLALHRALPRVRTNPAFQETAASLILAHRHVVERARIEGRESP